MQERCGAAMCSSQRKAAVPSMGCVIARPHVGSPRALIIERGGCKGRERRALPFMRRASSEVRGVITKRLYREHGRDV